MTQIEETIAEIETDLGLRPGFFSDLKKDDDWSFLIKVHALEEALLIKGLSELRNETVHKIEGIHFMFSDYIAKLDKQQRDSFVDTFGYAYTTNENRGNYDLEDRKLVISEPKNSIWWGVAVILAIIKLQVDTHFFKCAGNKSKTQNI
jgi:hypothetical protein